MSYPRENPAPKIEASKNVVDDGLSFLGKNLRQLQDSASRKKPVNAFASGVMQNCIDALALVEANWKVLRDLTAPAPKAVHSPQCPCPIRCGHDDTSWCCEGECLRPKAEEAKAALSPAVSEAELIEVLAAIEHERWSGWMTYLFSRCNEVGDGCSEIPAWAVERWTRQAATPYADLSEEEKESDRAEVRKTLAALRAQEGK